MTSAIKVGWRRLMRRLGLDYEDLPQYQRPEAYSYNAPLPACSIPGGCPEEMFTKGKYVYPYCERHFNMLQDGINVIAICDHPTCTADIIDSLKKQCRKHQAS